MKIETIAIHAGSRPDKTTGAVSTPLYLSTTFERDQEGGYPGGFQYSRAGNPNRHYLEECLSALEGGKAAAAFSSGNAAAAAVFQSLQRGDHVIVPDDMYHGISYLLKDIYSNWGLEYTFVDMSDPDRVDSAIKPSTKLIWIETPSNPLLKLYDIAAISDLAHRRNIKIACDNTFATPVLQSPFELGADLVMHSTTKYLSGHSDVLGGALVSRENDEFFGKIQNVQKLSGAVPSPFDCYLTMRGIKTLPYRMRGHCENALKIAAWLESHSRVESVFYPGLPGSPYYELARRQMKGFGGMLSFLVRGGADMARKVAGTTSLFVQATSLGGVESLIEHRASVEGPETKTPQNLLRVSAGLEHPDDLIADLDRALSA